MHDAAHDFQAQFTIARFDVIRCMSLVRVPGGGGPGDFTDAQVDARRRVGKALDALGGLGSPAGLSIGTQKGPPIGIEKGPLFEQRRKGACPGSEQEGPARDVECHYERRSGARGRLPVCPPGQAGEVSIRCGS